ncbi:MAG: leucine-rich repeat protein [Mycoplasmatales bacterium]|nr:leucine-rich repeat protein [Mycoplasmatales bacterium]
MEKTNRIKMSSSSLFISASRILLIVSCGNNFNKISFKNSREKLKEEYKFNLDRIIIHQKKILENSYKKMKMNYLDISSAEKISDGAFENIKNSFKTKVIMPLKFNLEYHKNRIFGKNNWNKIKFTVISFKRDIKNENYFKNNMMEFNSFYNPISKIALPLAKKINENSFKNLYVNSLFSPKVEKICDSAFKNSSLNFLYLPKVKIIEDNTFFDSSLTSLSLPKVKIIGIKAFNNSKLTYLSLPKVKKISNFAFENSNLSSLNLPNVTEIQSSAFEFSSLLKLSLPKVKEIHLNAFYNSKLEYIFLPKVLHIGRGAFANSPISKLHLSRVKKIGRHAFRNIINKKTTIVIIPKIFDNKIQKNSIFGEGNWSKISFRYI